MKKYRLLAAFKATKIAGGHRLMVVKHGWVFIATRKSSKYMFFFPANDVRLSDIELIVQLKRGMFEVDAGSFSDINKQYALTT